MKTPMLAESESEFSITIKHGLVFDLSEGFAAITGYSREALINKNITYILNDLLRLNVKTVDISKTNSIENCFIFNRSMDFKKFTITVQKDCEEDFIYLFFDQQPLVSIDNSLSFIHQLICNSVTGMAMYYAEDLTLLKASEEYKTIMLDRYGQSDIVGKKIYEFFPMWPISIDRAIWEMVIQTQKPYHNMEWPSLNSKTKELEYFDNSITPIIDKGSVKYLIVNSSNVTEKVRYRKENEKKTLMIEKQKELLETVIDNQSDGICIVNTMGSIIISNKEFKKRYAPHQIDTFEDLYHSAKFYDIDENRLEYQDMPAFRVSNGETIDNEIIKVEHYNDCSYFKLNGKPIYNKNGTFDFAFLSAADITENETFKAKQQTLLLTEKREKENLEKMIVMKDDFLSLISHEFRTPLTVINSALQTLELIYHDQLTEKVESYMHIIKQNINRQVRLVNNLLDITRANSGRIKLNMRNLDVVFMTKAIVESVSVYALQKDLDIRFICKCKQKIISLDEEKYERILLNLLSNAIKFTPAGKSITVEFNCCAGKIVIRITDEGIGIPKEKHEYIFERFGQVDSTYSREVEGSGIGLSLVKQMVNTMGGKIYVQSELGQGSSFFVELPDILDEEAGNEVLQREEINEKLIQSIAIEFSDIYF